MEWYQADKPCRVQRRLQKSICDHGANQGAHRLVNTGLTVISLGKDLDEPVLVRLPYGLEIVPPVVSIV